MIDLRLVCKSLFSNKLCILPFLKRIVTGIVTQLCCQVKPPFAICGERSIDLGIHNWLAAKTLGCQTREG